MIPNIAPIVIVQVSLVAALAILAEAALSFLGRDVAVAAVVGPDARRAADHTSPLHPGADRVPGAVPRAATLGFNLLGDGLRDATDPRLRSVSRGAATPVAGAGTVPDTAVVSPLVAAAPTTTAECGPMTALLEVEDLTVRFGDHVVVDDVSFTLERGRAAGDHRRVRLGQDADRACR